MALYDRRQILKSGLVGLLGAPLFGCDVRAQDATARANTPKDSALENTVKEANQFYEADKFDKAVPLYEAALKKDSNNDELHFRIAFALGEQGKHEESLSHYKTGGEILRKRNGTIDVDTEIAKLEKEIEQSAPVETYVKLGLFYDSKRDNDKLKEVAEAAVKIDDKNSMAHALLGLYHLKLKDYDTAKKKLDKSIELDSHNAMAYIFKGWAEFDSGNAEGALELDKKAKKYFSEVREQFNSSRIFRHAGRTYGRLAINARKAREFDKSIELYSVHNNQYQTYLAVDPNGKFAKDCSSSIDKVNKIVEKIKSLK